MGSFQYHSLGRVSAFIALVALTLLTALSTSVLAGGESLLLPGYVQPRNAPQTNIPLVTTPILPGWGTPGPGFVPQPNPSGLKLIIDNSWPDLPSYRLVRLEFLANKPPLEDRRMRVQIKFRNNNYGRAVMSVATDEIVLPAGQSSVKYQLYFPSQGQLQINEVRTTEDGGAWPDLSCNIFSNTPNTKSLVFLSLLDMGSGPSVLANGPNVQGNTGINSAPDPPNPGIASEYRNGATYSFPVTYGWTGFSNLGELPNSPLGYDCFKAVLCRAEQLEALRAEHPVQWDALRSWVATGGTLLVWPQEQKKTASTRAAQLQLDDLFPHGESDSNKTPRASWQKKTINVVPEPLQNNQQNYGYGQSYNYPVQQAMPSVNTRVATDPGFDYPERSWFMGTLAVLPDEQYFDTVYSHIQNSTSQPMPSTPLPLVGMPPITMFQILITLFVILIGPVNYFYFKKKKKMNWLLITVPLGALGITGLLLAYTLIKDGIGVRSWSQSYTVLDQTQKLAATRQQFCLFAGITPGDGLRFRPQVNFQDQGIDENNNYNYRYRDTRNWDYSWDVPSDGSSGTAEQHLRSGWLPARTLKLYETRECARCQRGIQINVTGDSCQLVNKLGAKILRVYVVDGDRAWSNDAVEDGGSAAASLLDETQLANLRTTIEQEMLQASNNTDRIERTALSPQDNTIQDNFLGMRKLHGRVYLAIVDDWPDLQTGVAASAVESWGPHIILGVW